jgi:hypothetical protein
MRVPTFIQNAMGPPIGPRPEEGRLATEMVFQKAIAFSRLPDAKRYQLMRQGRVPATPPGWKMWEDGSFGPIPKPPMRRPHPYAPYQGARKQDHF